MLQIHIFILNSACN